jgi:K+-sensing histidine kinase KdpD
MISRYGFALVLGVVATAYGIHLHAVGIVVLLSVLGVILSAAYGGTGPGLVCAAVSIATIDYFVLAPAQSMRVVAGEDAGLLVIYTGVAVVAAGIVGVLRRWWAEQSLRALRAEGMVGFLDRQLEERETDVRTFHVLRSAARRASLHPSESSRHPRME